MGHIFSFKQVYRSQSCVVNANPIFSHYLVSNSVLFNLTMVHIFLFSVKYPILLTIFLNFFFKCSHFFSFFKFMLGLATRFVSYLQNLFWYIILLADYFLNCLNVSYHLKWYITLCHQDFWFTYVKASLTQRPKLVWLMVYQYKNKYIMN